MPYPPNGKRGFAEGQTGENGRDQKRYANNQMPQGASMVDFSNSLGTNHPINKKMHGIKTMRTIDGV